MAFYIPFYTDVPYCSTNWIQECPGRRNHNHDQTFLANSIKGLVVRGACCFGLAFWLSIFCLQFGRARARGKEAGLSAGIASWQADAKYKSPSIPKGDRDATLTIKLDGNWSSFQLANCAPPLGVTDSAIAPSARMLRTLGRARPKPEKKKCTFFSGPIGAQATLDTWAKRGS